MFENNQIKIEHKQQDQQRASGVQAKIEKLTLIIKYKV